MILSLCDFCLAACRCDSTAQKTSPLGAHDQAVLVLLNLGRTQPQAGGPQGMHSTPARSCSDPALALPAPSAPAATLPSCIRRKGQPSSEFPVTLTLKGAPAICRQRMTLRGTSGLHKEAP